MVALKTFAVTGLLVATTSAQTWPQDFPACGVTCVTNMVGQTQQLGCTAGDAKCFCANANFHYGVRDCSNQACGNQQAAGVVQDYGRAYCSQAGQTVPTVTTLNPAPTGGAGAGNGNGAGPGASNTAGAGAGNGAGPSVSISNPVAIATSAIVSVVTNNGVPTTTTVGFTTIFSQVTGAVGGAIPTPTVSVGTGGVSVGTVGGVSTLTSVTTRPDGSLSTITSAVTTGTNTVVTSAVTTSAIVSTITSGSSTFVSTIGSTTIGTTTTRPNFAAQATAAPGLLAAAGLMALLL